MLPHQHLRDDPALRSPRRKRERCATACSQCRRGGRACQLPLRPRTRVLCTKAHTHVGKSSVCISRPAPRRACTCSGRPRVSLLRQSAGDLGIEYIMRLVGVRGRQADRQRESQVRPKERRRLQATTARPVSRLIR